MPSSPPLTGSRARLLVPVLAFAGITVSLMQTILIPLVPHLPRLLDASPADTAWAITATLLAAAVITPVAGRLADMYGKRRLILISLGLQVAGSVVGALSTSLVPLVVGRALQGAAVAVIPLGISVMRDLLPRERLGSATALMSASLGVGGALGLPTAAFVAEHADWHALFWGAAAFGALALVLIAVLVPESAVRSGGRFDGVGALGLSIVLVCLLLAVSKGGEWGWGGPRVLGLFATGLVVLAGWVWWELRVRQPLVDLRISRRRQVLLTNTASAVFGFAMFAQSLVLPTLLQLPTETGYGLGLSVLAAGLVMGPAGLVMMAMSPVSAFLSARYGPRVTLMAGAAVVALGYVIGVFWLAHVWQLMAISAINAAGIGLAYGAMPALVMGAVPVGETAAANSLNNLMRAIGTSVASAVAGLLLAELTTTVGSITAPSLSAFRLVMLIAAAASVIALAIAAFIPRTPPDVDGETPEPATARIAPDPGPAERAHSGARG